jgi:hypothetical protein
VSVEPSANDVSVKTDPETLVLGPSDGVRVYYVNHGRGRELVLMNCDAGF